jgi:hypothetical protein
MTDERRQRILQIADELEAQGLPATSSSFYSRAFGYRGHGVAVMKQRRAERAAAGGVLVAEEDDEPEEELSDTPAAVLQEDLAQLTHSYDAWHLALERLWQIEEDGPLSEANFSRKQWLEYQMVQNLQAQESLRAALEVARLREAVLAAQRQHDEALPAARVLAEETLRTVATLAEHLAALAAVFQHQVDGFFAPRSRRGEQYFDVADGATYVKQLLTELFPQDFRAHTMVELLLQRPPTEGHARSALDTCVRLKPFSTTVIASYLAQQQTEGASHGDA